MDSMKLNLKKFQAISEAEILLNGITVVTGINGCGKSTLSKLLYNTLNIDINFEKRIVNQVYSRLKIVDYRISQRLSPVKDFKEIETLDELEDYFINRINSLLEENENENDENIDERYLSSFKKYRNFFISDIKEPHFKKDIEQLFKKYKSILNNRNIELLTEMLQKYFKKPDLSAFQTFQLSVKDNPLIDWENKILSPIMEIDQVFYIDTPMIVGASNDFPVYGNFEHWGLLAKAMGTSLRMPNEKELEICAEYEGEVIGGNLSYDPSRAVLEFHQKNAPRPFNIEMCATGIKSFSTLLMLLKNGYLSERTMLILDEPEVHLHPTWIVEYARLLVTLHENLGVHLFIATHDDRMVAAIKNVVDYRIEQNKISEECTHFYKVEKTEDEFPSYKYVLCPDRKTGPIHTDFNQSFDLIDIYRGYDENDN